MTSQKAVILEHLHQNNWVTLPSLMSLKHRGRRIANHTARLSELREEGHKIINSSIYNKQEKFYESAYMLVPMKEGL